MRASDRCIAFIASQEGFVGHPYKPVPAERYWTIGYGHYGPDVHPGMRMTPAQALVVLRRDVATAEAGVNRLIAEGAKFTQGQFDALVSFAFNCGNGALMGSIRSLALSHHNQSIPSIMELYVHGAGGVLLSALVRRRALEAAMFRSGPVRRTHSYAHLTPSEAKMARAWDRGNHSALLRRQMVARRKLIWRLAQPRPKGDGKGWGHAHRLRRYHALLARTT